MASIKFPQVFPGKVILSTGNDSFEIDGDVKILHRCHEDACLHGIPNRVMVESNPVEIKLSMTTKEYRRFLKWFNIRDTYVDKKSFLWRRIEVGKAFRECGNAISHALGFHWTLGKLSALLKRIRGGKR